MKITWDFLGLGRCFLFEKQTAPPKKTYDEDNEKRSSRSVLFPLEVHHSTVWGVDSVAKWRPKFLIPTGKKKTWLDTMERELVPPVKLTRLAGNPPFPIVGNCIFIHGGFFFCHYFFGVPMISVALIWSRTLWWFGIMWVNLWKLRLFFVLVGVF